ncbi:hypothetical protein Smic_01240 [Streptomyces microflavus]|uniref:ATP-grasp domain-containing protein n=1 Tax=Streptomyces microflavus TaxID=1919 RepID=A0A7J0CH01_STRMI|nr:hypothetical protein Smic_01240 [Streptomyces microflavus]
MLGGRRTVQQLQEESDYDVVFAEENMTLEQVMLADYPLEVDFGDWASVSRQVAGVHAQQPIHAVVTGVERLVPLAGRLREELELDHGITERAARNCIDKAATHRLLEGAGVPVPRTRVVSGAQEGGEAAEGLGLPVVVKPRDASSAAGLAYCDTRAEVEQAIAGILAGGRDSALVEEYVQGPEFGVFAARTAGATRVLWVVEGEVGPPPTFVKVGGHFPARLGEENRRELDRLADLALTAVGLDDWVAALQFTLTADGWRAGEINPRVPGGQAVEMIRSTTGWEPSLVAAEAALGRQGNPGPPTPPAACTGASSSRRRGASTTTPLPSARSADSSPRIRPSSSSTSHRASRCCRSATRAAEPSAVSCWPARVPSSWSGTSHGSRNSWQSGWRTSRSTKVPWTGRIPAAADNSHRSQTT